MPVRKIQKLDASETHKRKCISMGRDSQLFTDKSTKNKLTNTPATPRSIGQPRAVNVVQRTSRDTSFLKFIPMLALYLQILLCMPGGARSFCQPRQGGIRFGLSLRRRCRCTGIISSCAISSAVWSHGSDWANTEQRVRKIGHRLHILMGSLRQP